MTERVNLHTSQEPFVPLQELTRNERIDLAEKEIAYIVMGGQDGREYANSIAFILQVLDSLRDKESDFEDSAEGVV